MIMAKSMVLLVPLALSLCFEQAHGSLKLASYYQNHMVLQRGPQRAVLWGFADTEGDTVTAQVTGQGSAVSATVQGGKWKLMLPAITDPGPFVIKVSSADGHVTLRDVLFGDVWFCSGESNMELEMNQIINSSLEITTGLALKNIRLLKVAHVNSSTPQEDTSYYIKWTPPNRAYLPQFSAVCFLFAAYLQPHLGYPIGLVEAAWGGTSMEAWTPHSAVTTCPLPHYDTVLDCCPTSPDVLFNAMVNPLLDMTIFGVLWYQGETNEGQDEIYQCQMPALVHSWREAFNRRSLGQTALNLPFGYVQLATGNQGTLSQQPALRWAQTVGYGYIPNPALPSTFMAVAMDLKDAHSPLGPYHPRTKQDVAQRLLVGALNVAYGHDDVEFQGPFPSGFTRDTQHRRLTIEYDHGHTPLDIRSSAGFDVCCNAFSSQACDGNATWVAAPMTSHDASHVTLSYAGCLSRHLVGLRYAWSSQPCDFKQCAVYAADSGLPAPTYITKSPPV